jgi:hypothetical protein
MASLVVLQGVALVLLSLLVVGLLRTHAEILRSLHRLGVGADPAGAGAVAVGLRSRPWTNGRPAVSGVAEGSDLSGTTPAGAPVEVAVRGTGHDTLVAFLSSTCATCTGFWHAFAHGPSDLGLPAGARLVIVTKDMGAEDAGRVAHLAPPDHPVVMSSPAWDAYGVPTTPYFVHVDGRTGAVVGQGAGADWAQVSALLRQAVGDASAGRQAEGGHADTDERLLAAGIRPGDPRLYPDAGPPSGPAGPGPGGAGDDAQAGRE